MLRQSALCWSISENKCSFDCQSTISKKHLVINVVVFLHICLIDNSIQGNILPVNPLFTGEPVVGSTCQYHLLLWGGNLVVMLSECNYVDVQSNLCMMPTEHIVWHELLGPNNIVCASIAPCTTYPLQSMQHLSIVPLACVMHFYCNEICDKYHPG